MADSFLVRIDLKKLRENFATAGSEMTPDQVRDWLRESRFRAQADGWWLCEEITLALLAKEELIEYRRI